MVLMEELVHRLAEGPAAVTLLVMMPPAVTWGQTLAEGFTYAGALAADGFSEGSRGNVRSFFLRGPQKPWTAETLPTPDEVDTVIHLSRGKAQANIWPAIEPGTSDSALLAQARSAEHQDLANAVRRLLASGSGDPKALRLQAFLTQPFHVSQTSTGRAGVHVPLAATLRGAREILEGRYDDLPPEAFSFGGSVAEILEAWNKRVRPG